MSVAKWDGGKLTVFASTQGVSNTRTIAKDFDLPLSKVRIVCKYMGGGFGNKNQAQDYDYMAAAVARAASRSSWSLPGKTTTSVRTAAGLQNSATRSASRAMEPSRQSNRMP
ncbi:MAG TPA: molybdopterin cofactor-binding domain-containing protein [Candidatus Binatia bacterium]